MDIPVNTWGCLWSAAAAFISSCKRMRVAVARMSVPVCKGARPAHSQGDAFISCSKEAVGVSLQPQDIWSPEEHRFCSSWSMGSCSWDSQNYKDELPAGPEGQAQHLCWLLSHFLFQPCELFSHSGTTLAGKLLNASHGAQLRAFWLERDLLLLERAARLGRHLIAI